jgi:glycine/D-amino acid oxidase-like deaminating enzyme
MIVLRSLVAFLLCSLQLSFSIQEDNHFYIVGGGIIGMLEAYYALSEAEKLKENINILIFERNARFDQTPAMNIFPSLTPDEILAVIPRGEMLVRDMAVPFSQGDGIKVSDVPALDMSSKVVKDFIDSVTVYGEDLKGYKKREHALLSLGKLSMELWDEMYRQGDYALRSLMQASNYKPCKEVSRGETRLGQGYRIDIFYNQSGADALVQALVKKYRSSGYVSTRKLSPEDAVAIDPQLKDFISRHTKKSGDGLVWKKDAHAIWRPGGCINAHDFMLGLRAYLQEKAKELANGSSVNILLDHEVVGVDLGADDKISGLKVKVDKGKNTKVFPVPNKAKPSTQIVFAPGESVGTLRKLGFKEPDYAIFAGPSLRLDIPLSEKLKNKYKALNHAMEVHQNGVVLAWQAKNDNGLVTIGIAGTKAFYGDVMPKNTEDFARDRHLLQLNTAYELYPDIINEGLGGASHQSGLMQADLDRLIKKGMARAWVGARAVAYDEFPTLGLLYKGNNAIKNARVVTHLGSGGVSFGPASIRMGQIIARGDGASLGGASLFKAVSEFSRSDRVVNKSYESP